MKKISTVIVGIVFIVVGVIVGLNSFGITNINIFFDGWWTLLIIIPAFNGLVTNEEKTGSIIWLIIGIALLLGCQDLISFDILWKLTLPVILVFIGLSIMFNNNGKKESKDTDDNEYCACFNGQTIKYDGKDFKGALLNAIFGGITIDLTNAKVKDGAVIDATAVFGGVTILIPEDLKVEIKSTSVFGGVSDKTKNKEKKDKVTLHVKGCSIFGGVDIK